MSKISTANNISESPQTQWLTGARAYAQPALIVEAGVIHVLSSADTNESLDTIYTKAGIILNSIRNVTFIIMKEGIIFLSTRIIPTGPVAMGQEGDVVATQ